MVKYTGRKTKEHTDFDKITEQCRNGKITAAKAMKVLGMSKSTFYRRVK